MKNFKFAIIGFGHIGRRHATIANEYPGCQVVAIIDINPATRDHELFLKVLGILRVSKFSWRLRLNVI